MKVFDAFPIFDEMELLEARLAELQGVVYRHVITEGYQTHRGDRKPLYYSDHYRKYRKFPIVHLAIPLPQGKGDEYNWRRENHQRDEAQWLISAMAEDDDLVLATDVDEIPSAEAVPRIAEMAREGPVRLAMPLWYYSLDWQVWREGQPVIWTHGVAFFWRDRPSSLSELRLDWGANMAVVPDAGWHFSWFGNYYDRLRKLQSFAHEELDTSENRDLFDRWHDKADDLERGEMLDALGSPLVRSTSPISPTVREILSTRRRYR